MMSVRLLICKYMFTSIESTCHRQGKYNDDSEHQERLNHFFSGSTANLRHAPNKRRSVVRRLATYG